MRVQTMLNEELGWLEDVGIEQVNFEAVDTDGYRNMVTYALDDNLPEGIGLSYFYAINPEGFYWGHIGAGEYVFMDFTETLLGLMEFEEIDVDWLAANPKRVGSMVTDSIIADKDMFQSFWELKSYHQIYFDHPAIDNLRDYLTEYYETYIENAFPEEVNRARIRKGFER